MKDKVWMLASVLMVLIFGSTAFAAPTFRPSPDISKHVPGEILVGFRADAAVEQTDAAVKAVGGTVSGKVSFPQAKIYRVKLTSTSQEAMDQAITSLKANPLVKFAEPHARRWAHRAGRPGGGSVQSQSGDPLLWDQWGYYDIGANSVTPPSGTATPLVAVIDTGVDYTHPDLVGKVVKGYDFVNDDADPMDDYGHGTHVSGIIAAVANNAYGIAGIAWKAKILAIKALSAQGWGTDYEIALAIRYAANNTSVKVINMSLGGPHSETEEAAVSYAVIDKKKLLVASAGNDDTSDPSFPAGFADAVLYPDFAGKVLAVAAHGTDHCRASFPGSWGSNYGSWVSISAPGVDILSTVPPSLGYAGFDSWSGTSMAAPHVSGAAALLLTKYPTSTNTQISDLLTGNTAADPLLRDDTCWPNDLSSFERLEVFHVLEAGHFEECTKTGVLGFAMDAETGEPLLGAKVTTKLGTSTTGVDYVPYFGQVTDLSDQVVFQGYGLFQVYMNTTETAGHKMQINKSKYAPFTLSGIDTAPCEWAYVGSIPVPPKKGKYWIAVTWDNYYTGAGYDSYLCIPGYDNGLGGCIDPYWDPGELRTDEGSPLAKVFWDSDDMYDQFYGNRRAYSEVIRIKKTVAGDYWFYIWDWLNGPDSTSWSESGIKVYIYRWDTATSTPKLVKEYTPPPGQGEYWDICFINGNNITDLNSLTN